MILKTKAEELTRVYFKYVDKEGIRFPDSSSIVELYRHSLCIALGLKSKESGKFVASHSGDLSKRLASSLGSSIIRKMSEEDKHGVVEASLHILKLSVKKVGI